MKCFTVHIGGVTFGLPLDTSISIQDLLLQAIPLEVSFKKEFTWRNSQNPTESSACLTEVEDLPGEEAEEIEEPLLEVPVPQRATIPTTSADQLLDELGEAPPPRFSSQSFISPPPYDDDIPF